MIVTTEGDARTRMTCLLDVWQPVKSERDKKGIGRDNPYHSLLAVQGRKHSMGSQGTEGSQSCGSTVIRTATDTTTATFDTPLKCVLTRGLDSILTYMP